MASEIRVDTSKNASGLCTVTYSNTGAVLSGITTGTFIGDITGDVTGNVTGNMSGDFTIDDKIIHAGDTNTAIRFPSADTFTVETGGSERFRITSNGLKVGTTVDNNYAAIHAHGGSATRLHLTSSNTGTTTSDGAIIMIDSSSNMEILNKENTNLEFFTNNSERLRIDNNGKILVATTTTSEAHANQDELIIGSTSDNNNHGLTIVTPSSKYGTVAFSDGSSGTSQGLLEYNHSGDYMRIYTAASERLRIDSSGKVSVGTATANELFEVAGAINFTGAKTHNKANCGTLTFESATAFLQSRGANTSTRGKIGFNIAYSNGSSGMTPLEIDASGRVVVGNTTHAGGAQFVVMGGNINTYAAIALGNKVSAPSANDTFAMFRFNSGSGGTSRGAEIIAAADATWTAGSNYPSRLVFSTTGNGNATASTERLRIDSNGYVGIKLTNPHSYYAKDLVVKCIDQGGITLKSSSTSDTQYLMFADGTSGNERYRGYIGYQHNTGSGGGEHLQIAASGTMKLRVDSDGLKFNSDTATANALYDYEEGTWTPTWYGSSSGTGTTFSTSTNFGSYVKIGKVVHVRCFAVFTSKNSASGNFLMGGLPFPNSGNYNVTSNVRLDLYAASGNYNGEHLSVYFSDGSTVGYWQQQDDDGTVANIALSDINANTNVMFNATYEDWN